MDVGVHILQGGREGERGGERERGRGREGERERERGGGERKREREGERGGEGEKMERGKSLFTFVRKIFKYYQIMLMFYFAFVYCVYENHRFAITLNIQYAPTNLQFPVRPTERHVTYHLHSWFVNYPFTIGLLFPSISNPFILCS